MRWGEDARDPARPTVWVHAPSVGEGLQAQALARALRARRPEVQIVFTHFSPSAEALAARFGAEVSAYLPWDLRTEVSCVLEATAPDLLLFTKTEVWPVLAEEARRRGIPVVIAAAAVPPGAGRRGRVARALLGPTWRSLRVALANSVEDAEGLRLLGVPSTATVVTGDPGVDSAAERALGADPAAPYLAPFHADPAPTVVAGSTWPSDEARLLPALARVRERVPGVRVIVAPHEPSPDRVGVLLGALMEAGFHPSTLGHVEGDGVVGGSDAVIVDRVGVLAHLYTIGSVAYVGGGFHGAGLHSVLEPAAAGLPVFFGPEHGNALAAGELASLGAAVVTRDEDAMVEVMVRWLSEEGAGSYAGARALGYIGTHRGAAARSAVILEGLLDLSDEPATGMSAAFDLPEITATELKARIDAGDVPVLLDVRDPFEYDIADLPELGQLRIPTSQLMQRAGELDESQEIVLYCRSGSRSEWATRLLQQMGFERVVNLRGGVLAWGRDVDPTVPAY